MITPVRTRLSITLKQPGSDEFDGVGAATTTIHCDVSDCSVHAYFKLFEQILYCAGFCQEVIMMGGAQLAFNEMRSVEMMRKVATTYDLKLLEDLIESSDDTDSDA